MANTVMNRTAHPVKAQAQHLKVLWSRRKPMKIKLMI